MLSMILPAMISAIYGNTIRASDTTGLFFCQDSGMVADEYIHPPKSDTSIGRTQLLRMCDTCGPSKISLFKLKSVSIRRIGGGLCKLSINGNYEDLHKIWLYLGDSLWQNIGASLDANHPNIPVTISKFSKSPGPISAMGQYWKIPLHTGDTLTAAEHVKLMISENGSVHGEMSTRIYNGTKLVWNELEQNFMPPRIEYVYYDEPSGETFIVITELPINMSDPNPACDNTRRRIIKIFPDGTSATSNPMKTNDCVWGEKWTYAPIRGSIDSVFRISIRKGRPVNPKSGVKPTGYVVTHRGVQEQ